MLFAKRLHLIFLIFCLIIEGEVVKYKENTYEKPNNSNNNN